MPGALRRMYPARTSSRWLGTSASAGSSRRVRRNSEDIRSSMPPSLTAPRRPPRTTSAGSALGATGPSGPSLAPSAASAPSALLGVAQAHDVLDAVGCTHVASNITCSPREAEHEPAGAAPLRRTAGSPRSSARDGRGRAKLSASQGDPPAASPRSTRPARRGGRTPTLRHEAGLRRSITAALQSGLERPRRGRRTLRPRPPGPRDAAVAARASRDRTAARRTRRHRGRPRAGSRRAGTTSRAAAHVGVGAPRVGERSSRRAQSTSDRAAARSTVPRDLGVVERRSGSARAAVVRGTSPARTSSRGPPRHGADAKPPAATSARGPDGAANATHRPCLRTGEAVRRRRPAIGLGDATPLEQRSRDDRHHAARRGSAARPQRTPLVGRGPGAHRRRTTAAADRDAGPCVQQRRCLRDTAAAPGCGTARTGAGCWAIAAAHGVGPSSCSRLRTGRWRRCRPARSRCGGRRPGRGC